MKTTALIALTALLVGCGKPHNAANSITSVPGFSPEDVREFVKPGRLVAEVTKRFGVPNSVTTNDGHVVMYFCNPIDMTSIPVNSPCAFTASFTNGIVEKWEFVQVTISTPP